MLGQVTLYHSDVNERKGFVCTCGTKAESKRPDVRV